MNTYMVIALFDNASFKEKATELWIDNTSFKEKAKEPWIDNTSFKEI